MNEAGSKKGQKALAEVGVRREAGVGGAVMPGVRTCVCVRVRGSACRRGRRNQAGKGD